MASLGKDLLSTGSLVLLVSAIRSVVALLPASPRITRRLTVALLLLAVTVPADCLVAVLSALPAARWLRAALLATSVVCEVAAVCQVVYAGALAVRSLRRPGPPGGHGARMSVFRTAARAR